MIVFISGDVEGREHPAELLNENPETGGLNLRVFPEGEEPFLAVDVPFHLEGRPGHWSFRPEPKPEPLALAPAAGPKRRRPALPDA